MKKLIATIATAALPAITTYAEIIVVTNTHHIATIPYEVKYIYDCTDAAPRTATLLEVQGALGDSDEGSDVEIASQLIKSNGTETVTWTVTGIADGAISGILGLESVDIPYTILEIGAYAFADCPVFKSISIPYGVRYIGERAFVNTIITEIKVPASLLDMGGNISAGTLFTSTINIDQRDDNLPEESSHFKYSDDGVLYNRDMTKLYACPTRAEGTITIPGTLTNICTDAFFGCHRLTYLNIPATVETIGSGAFNVSGIWPGLSAPESTPKLKTVFFNGPPPEATDDIFDGAPEDLVIYALSDKWNGMSTWKGKKVKPIDSRTLHQLGEGIYPTPPEIIGFKKRYYEFQKIEDYHLKKQEEHNKLLNENLIMNKNNNASNNNKTGFTKEFYENISNNKLLGITFNKELYYNYKNSNKRKKEINEFIKTNSNERKHMEVKRALNLKNERENFQKDVNYVTSL